MPSAPQALGSNVSQSPCAFAVATMSMFHVLTGLLCIPPVFGTGISVGSPLKNVSCDSHGIPPPPRGCNSLVNRVEIIQKSHSLLLISPRSVRVRSSARRSPDDFLLGEDLLQSIFFKFLRGVSAKCRECRKGGRGRGWKRGKVLSFGGDLLLLARGGDVRA